MFKGGMRLLALLSGLLVTAMAAQGQAPSARFLQPTASVSGSTGLWKVLTADTLPPGRASFSVWYDRINRNPGFLTVSTIGFGGAAGVTDWLEFGASLEANRRVLVRRADQLSLGQQALGFFGDKTPGAQPLANELVFRSNLLPQLRSPATPTGALTGAAGFNNLLPFAGQQREGNGIGAVTLGVKVNVLPESLGYPLGLAVRTYASIPTRRSLRSLFSKPTQTGDWQYGSDVIVSKNLGELARLHGNVGFRRIQSPGRGRDQVLLADAVPLGFGFTLPRTTRVQLLGEVTADLFVGNHTPNTSFDAPNPVDATVGFRAFLSPYLSISAGYRHTLNQFGGDKNGFIAELAYSYGPPPFEDVEMLSPPTVTCSADPPGVFAGEPVRLSAQGVSSTGAALAYSWSATGGTIEGSGPIVQLRTGGMAAGIHTATVRASEELGRFADCTTRITVRLPAPVPGSGSREGINVPVEKILAALTLRLPGEPDKGFSGTPTDRREFVSRKTTNTVSGANRKRSPSSLAQGASTQRALRKTSPRGVVIARAR